MSSTTFFDKQPFHHDVHKCFDSCGQYTSLYNKFQRLLCEAFDKYGTMISVKFLVDGEEREFFYFDITETMANYIMENWPSEITWRFKKRGDKPMADPTAKEMNYETAMNGPVFVCKKDEMFEEKIVDSKLVVLDSRASEYREVQLQDLTKIRIFVCDKNKMDEIKQSSSYIINHPRLHRTPGLERYIKLTGTIPRESISKEQAQDIMDSFQEPYELGGRDVRPLLYYRFHGFMKDSQGDFVKTMLCRSANIEDIQGNLGGRKRRKIEDGEQDPNGSPSPGPIMGSDGVARNNVQQVAQRTPFVGVNVMPRGSGVAHFQGNTPIVNNGLAMAGQGPANGFNANVAHFNGQQVVDTDTHVPGTNDVNNFNSGSTAGGFCSPGYGSPVPSSANVLQPYMNGYGANVNSIDASASGSGSPSPARHSTGNYMNSPAVVAASRTDTSPTPSGSSSNSSFEMIPSFHGYDQNQDTIILRNLIECRRTQARQLGGGMQIQKFCRHLDYWLSFDFVDVTPPRDDITFIAYEETIQTIEKMWRWLQDGHVGQFPPDNFPHGGGGQGGGSYPHSGNGHPPQNIQPRDGGQWHGTNPPPGDGFPPQNFRSGGATGQWGHHRASASEKVSGDTQMGQTRTPAPAQLPGDTPTVYPADTQEMPAFSSQETPQELRQAQDEVAGHISDFDTRPKKADENMSVGDMSSFRGEGMLGLSTADPSLPSFGVDPMAITLADNCNDQMGDSSIVGLDVALDELRNAINHQQLQEQIDKLKGRNIEAYIQFFENVHFREVLSTIREAENRFMNDKASQDLSAIEKREAHARDFAQALRRSEDWAVELNKCRKTALKFLYRLSDDFVSDVDDAGNPEWSSEVEDVFKLRRVDQIFSACLLLDRTMALRVMEDSSTKETGLGWYSKHNLAQFKLEFPDAPENPRGAAMNKRLWYYFQLPAYKTDELIQRWMQPAIPERYEKATENI